MKKLILTVIIAAMGMFFLPPAEAFSQSTTGSMNVTATVVASCTVTTAPMDFGPLSAASNATANTSITVNCSNGTPYRIDIDAGLNYLPGMAGVTRNMKQGLVPPNLNILSAYNLFQDISLTTPWGDNGATYCPTCSPSVAGKTGTGTGNTEIHTVYGEATSTALATPGTYSDTVTVTVRY